MKSSALGSGVMAFVLATGGYAQAQQPNRDQMLAATLQMGFVTEIARKCELVEPLIATAAAHRAKSMIAELGIGAPPALRPQLQTAINGAAEQGRQANCADYDANQRSAMKTAVKQSAAEMVGIGMNVADGSFNGLVSLSEPVRVAAQARLQQAADLLPQARTYSVSVRPFLAEIAMPACQTQGPLAAMAIPLCIDSLSAPTASADVQEGAQAMFVAISAFLSEIGG